MTPKRSSVIVFAVTLMAAVVTAAPVMASGPILQTLVVLKGLSNGGQPWSAPISDNAGNFYGTTSEGGDGPCQGGKWKNGCGTVYKLSPPVSGTQWSETLIYQFHGGGDGNFPIGGLIFDKAGNLYGTTEDGGTYGGGTVFELTPPASGSGAWKKTNIYSFGSGNMGVYPFGTLIFDNLGNLYGTAYYGGNCNGNSCGGVAFELSPPAAGGTSWTATVLHTFQGPTGDGMYPQSALVIDSGGNLYGTTILGGTGDNCGVYEYCGTIFELSPPASQGGAWTETILHNFSVQSTDGQYPRSGLVRGKSGAYYGTTQGGGTFYMGTVYELVPPASAGGTWIYNVIYSFNGADGVSPFAALASGSNGSLYGTTMFGGPGQEGVGSVFQLTPPSQAGGSWTETTLATFNNKAYPFAGLNFGKDGWLYGATMGGLLTQDCATSTTGQQLLGCGVLFRVLP